MEKEVREFYYNITKKNHEKVVVKVVVVVNVTGFHVKDGNPFMVHPQMVSFHVNVIENDL